MNVEVTKLRGSSGCQPPHRPPPSRGPAAVRLKVKSTCWAHYAHPFVRK
jgi:hypothetical protein